MKEKISLVVWLLLFFLIENTYPSNWILAPSGTVDTLTSFQEAADSAKAGDSVYIIGSAVFEETAYYLFDMNGGANPSPDDTTPIYFVGCNASGVPYTDTNYIHDSASVALDSLMAIDGLYARNIVFSNIWFDGGEQCVSGVVAAGTNDITNITFKRCKFTGFTDSIFLVYAETGAGNGWFFESCIFIGGTNGLLAGGTSRAQFNVRCCHFEDIDNVAMEMSSTAGTVAANNTFANVGVAIWIPYTVAGNVNCISNNSILHARYGIDIIQNQGHEIHCHNNSFMDCDTAVFTNGTNGEYYFSHFSYNNYYANTADCDINSGNPLGELNIAVDPEYTDTTTGSINMKKLSTSGEYKAGIYNPHLIGK